MLFLLRALGVSVFKPLSYRCLSVPHRWQTLCAFQPSRFNKASPKSSLHNPIKILNRNALQYPAHLRKIPRPMRRPLMRLQRRGIPILLVNDISPRIRPRLQQRIQQTPRLPPAHRRPQLPEHRFKFRLVPGFHANIFMPPTIQTAPSSPMIASFDALFLKSLPADLVRAAYISRSK
jgi:hypothetical protein